MTVTVTIQKELARDPGVEFVQGEEDAEMNPVQLLGEGSTEMNMSSMHRNGPADMSETDREKRVDAQAC